MGFEPIGVYRQVGFKHGAWHDVGWWQLKLRDPEDPPNEPLSLAAIQARPEWATLVASGERIK
jgi:phosphinothricin acetyltransferase